MSEKREKFLKYGNIRLTNALDSIRRLGNLSNKRAYDYSKTDIDKITSALNKEVSALKAKFSEASKKGSKKNNDILI